MQKAPHALVFPLASTNAVPHRINEGEMPSPLHNPYQRLQPPGIHLETSNPPPTRANMPFPYDVLQLIKRRHVLSSINLAKAEIELRDCSHRILSPNYVTLFLFISIPFTPKPPLQRSPFPRLCQAILNF